MIHTFKKVIYFVLFIIAFSCEKDDTINETEVIIPETENSSLEGFSDNFGPEISRSFIGTIIDRNQQPIENVQITIGNSTASTDQNGTFIIENATINERFGYVKASKSGYIHGSRSIVPVPGVNKVTIMLLEETIAGSTSSGTSETISLSNGASVSLNGAYINEDGSTYQGNVDVILHHLDPTNTVINEQMPGMLYAANSEGEERLLQTLGMLAVELRGANGEDLNLADGTTAEIRVPVDASLLSDAPSIIPLWYFDEENGYWVEDGEATLIGSEYVGTVTHFSFWNCDIPAEAVYLCVTINSDDGMPLSNTLIEITSQNYGTRYSITNSLGIVCGLVPSNENLILSSQLNCNEEEIIIFSENIGPFTSNTSIEITPSYNELNEETITGTFTNCNGNPITNGYAQVTYNSNQYVDFVDDGTYQITFISCPNNDTFTIEAIDYEALQSSGEINYTFASPITNLATISSCNEIEEFITYQIDDNPAISHRTNISSQIADPFTNIFSEDSNGQFILSITDIAIGNAPMFGLVLTNTNGNWIGFGTTVNITFYITAIGEVGEYIDANFSGTYTNSDNVTHTIDGVLHIIRDS